MFKVYLLNHGYQVGDNYTTIETAMDKAKSTGFECVIINSEKSRVEFEYSPISGFKAF